MTPAVNAAKKAKIKFQLHSYQHDAGAASYGEEAAEKLNITPLRVFKTLLVELESDARRLAVAIVPVSDLLDLKALGSALGVKKVSMANARDAERATGYVLGGISPLGQKKQLPVWIDTSAQNHPSIYVSAGRRGLEIEISASDLAALTKAQFAAIARHP